MKRYKIRGKITYVNAQGNTSTAEISLSEVQATSSQDDQRREAINQWLASEDAPATVVASDITDWILFDAVQWSDEEMSAKYGAIQKGLF